MLLFSQMRQLRMEDFAFWDSVGQPSQLSSSYDQLNV